jgi:RimJ/RimL family protein N-acetyltransferase
VPVHPLPLPARIDTERMILRSWRLEDAPLVHEALTESTNELKPWIPWATPEPPTMEQTLTRLRTWVEEFASGKTFVYAAFDRQESLPIGAIGLYPRIGPGGLEIGYWIRSTLAGRGFASEGTRALTHAGFAVPGIDRIEIHCDPANTASRRIPEKLGYRLAEIRQNDRAPDGATHETAVYLLTRTDYEVNLHET